MCTGGYKRVQAVRPVSVAGGGWFEVLWNLECPVYRWKIIIILKTSLSQRHTMMDLQVYNSLNVDYE